MTFDLYPAIVDKLPYAYAYHEIVYDQAGKAVDYIFLDVNTAFEIMTGLKSDVIIGRKVTQVIPDLPDSEFDWIAKYDQVARTGNSTTFKQFSEPLNRWYEITAFSDRQGFFCTIFKEVTADVNEKTALQIIADVAENLLHGIENSEIYDAIAEAARKIAQAKFIGFNLYNSDSTSFSTIALAGASDLFIKVNQILGFNPVGKVWISDPVREKHIMHNEITEFNHLHELSGKVIALELVKSLERAFNVGKTYVVQIMNQDKILGDFTVMMPTGNNMQNVEYMKILSSLVGQYLEHRRTHNQLRNRTEELERFFDVTLDLLCIADTDGNFIRVNNAWCDLLGYTQGELENSKYLDFVHPDDQELTITEACNLHQQNQVRDFVNRYKTKDGSYKYIEWRSNQVGNLIYAAARDITEKINIEQSLRASEQKFRQYTEKAPLSIFVADLSGKIKMVNRAASEFSGYTQEELLELTIEDLASELFIDEAAAFLEAAQHKEIFSGEVQIKKKNGRPAWINMSSILLNDNEIIGFVQDITKNKEMNQALKESHNRFEELARQSRTVIWSVDAKGIYTYVNPFVRDFLGYAPAEMVGKMSLFDLFSEDERSEIKDRFAKVFNNKKPFVNFINKIESKDGSEIIVATNGLPILDDAGGLKGYNGSDTDITAKVRLEEEKYYEQEKFKATLLSVGDGIIATDDQGKITVMNAVAESLTEWSRDEAAGKPLLEVFNIVNENTNIPCLDPAQQVLRTGKMMLLENHTVLLSRSGRFIPIEDSAAPIKSKNGTVTGVVIVFRDYTEKREKQREVEYLSFHDHLTGLYNRRYMEDSMNRLDAVRNLPFSIIMADVNGLKLTNDAYGHDMGDRLLQKVADLLRKACRCDDIIARTGGDEFTILLPRTSIRQVDTIKRRIQSLVQKTKLESVLILLAIGVATKTDQTQDIKGIMKQADNLMYKNKLKFGKTMRSQTIETVLRSINNKYDNEQIHTERVSTYSVALARAMNLTENEVDEIRKMSVLHDIGKITVAPEILNKVTALNDEEWNAIKQHVVTGYNILKGVEEYAGMAEVVLHHHERWDGKGYPSGIKGQAIPLYSRIITVADAYEAMTAERPYQKARTKAEAVAELKKCAGSQFDSAIVKIFIDQVLGTD